MRNDSVYYTTMSMLQRWFQMPLLLLIMSTLFTKILECIGPTALELSLISGFQMIQYATWYLGFNGYPGNGYLDTGVAVPIAAVEKSCSRCHSVTWLLVLTFISLYVLSPSFSCQQVIVFVVIAAESSAPQSIDAGKTMDRGHGRSVTDTESSVTASNGVSSDCSSSPHLLRSKSSNGFQTASGRRRFFLPSIDRTGSVSAQRRPATSGDVRLNNELQADTGGEVHRAPRAAAVPVWNSLTTLSNTSPPADLTCSSFIPTPPPRKNSVGHN